MRLMVGKVSHGFTVEKLSVFICQQRDTKTLPGRRPIVILKVPLLD